MTQLQLRRGTISPALLETFPISFRDEKSIWRGATKDPQWSELKDTGKLAPQNPCHSYPQPISLLQRGLHAPSCQSLLSSICGRESRSENNRHLAARRGDKSLAEPKPKRSFKVGNRHLTALKRASPVLLCLYNALPGRAREVGSIDVLGTHCLAGRSRANPNALSLIQALLGIWYIAAFPSS